MKGNKKNNQGSFESEKFIEIYSGAHVKNSLDSEPTRFEWCYKILRNRVKSKIIIQKVVVEKGNKKNIGEPEIFDEIFCKLTRPQARLFVKNYLEIK